MARKPLALEPLDDLPRQKEARPAVDRKGAKVAPEVPKAGSGKAAGGDRKANDQAVRAKAGVVGERPGGGGSLATPPAGVDPKAARPGVRVPEVRPPPSERRPVPSAPAPAASLQLGASEQVGQPAPGVRAIEHEVKGVARYTYDPGKFWVLIDAAVRGAVTITLYPRRGE